MATTRRLVLDVLKPHEPPLREFAAELAETETVDAVNATLVEVDRQVETVSVTVESEALEFDRVAAAVEDLGGSVHSVDQVVAGERVLDRVQTPQD